MEYSIKDVTMEKIATMHGEQFEELIMYLYELQGYNVVKTPKTGDFGVDLVAEKLGVKMAIQCKRQMSAVSISAVQEVYTGKNMYSTENAIVITSSRFTKSAIAIADRCNVSLIDGDRVMAIIEELKENEHLLAEHEKLKENVKTFYESTGLLKELIAEYDGKMKTFEETIGEKILTEFNGISKTYQENVLGRYKDSIENIDDSMRQYVRLEKEGIVMVNEKQTEDIDNLKRNMDSAIDHINEIEDDITTITESVEDVKAHIVDKVVHIKDSMTGLRAFAGIAIVLSIICVFKVFGG